ncbi:hypothetical protein, partial [uncultured Marinobacter sp.]|uniref:hypothetical protein n=1 Tax=uncultured Marinobacter sp. TaxID=187379 RepID=UPI002591F9DE
MTGGVATIAGTVHDPTETEAAESRDPYASLFSGPVPVCCLTGTEPSDHSGASSNPKNAVPGASASSSGPDITYVRLPPLNGPSVAAGPPLVPSG